MARKEKFTEQLPVVHVEPSMRADVEWAKAELKVASLAATVRELIRRGLETVEKGGNR